MNPGMRVEHVVALFAVMVNHALGGHAKLENFIPRREEVRDATLNDVMNILASGKDR